MTYKIQVYVPKTHLEAVRMAMGAAGAGAIGNYNYCAFVSAGMGYFQPLEGANPHIGTHNKIETVEEYKIETICTAANLKSVIKAIKAAHPYEEVAMDVFGVLDLNRLEEDVSTE